MCPGRTFRPLVAEILRSCERRGPRSARGALQPGVEPGQVEHHPAHALGVAAIRELWEETGLILGRPGTWDVTPPPDWETFAATGHVPDASALRFVFRAITPPGRPRRFDARFFVVDADEAVVSDLDDFGAACDELSALQWIPLEEARSFDLPFITEVVLAEVQQRAADPRPPASVPFFANNNENRAFMRLRGLVDARGRDD